MSQESHNSQQEPAPQTVDKRSRSVVIYILILFIAAFLLMALSFLMNQRSNTETMGALQSSVSTMAELQAAQEKIIALQDELDETKDTLNETEEYLENFEDAAETARNQASHAEYRLEQTQIAMDLFWQLDEAYVLEDAERCGEILAEMNRNAEDPLDGYLSERATDRYAEICEALDEPHGADISQ